MRKFKRRFLILASVFVLLPGVARGSTGLRPEWTKGSFYDLSPNDSFLINTQRSATSSSELFGEELFDPKLAKETQLKYQDLNRDYDMRRRYGLVDQREEQDHAERVGDFGRGMINEMRQAQIKKQLKSVEKNVLKDETLRQAAKPIAFAGALTAACTGTPVEVQLTRETKLRSTTNVLDQTGQLYFTSPDFRGSIDVAAKAPPRTVDPTVRDEKYRFSVLKDLPALNVTSGVSYGTTTSGLTTSLSKQLQENLTCVLDSTRSLYTDSALPAHQETVKLLYGISF